MLSVINTVSVLKEFNTSQAEEDIHISQIYCLTEQMDNVCVPQRELVPRLG